MTINSNKKGCSIQEFLLGTSWSQLDDNVLEILLLRSYNETDLDFKLKAIDKLFALKKYNTLVSVFGFEEDKKIRRRIIFKTRKFIDDNYSNEDIFDENLEVKNVLKMFFGTNSIDDSYSNSINVIKHIKVKKYEENMPK